MRRSARNRFRRRFVWSLAALAMLIGCVSARAEAPVGEPVPAVPPAGEAYGPDPAPPSSAGQGPSQPASVDPARRSPKGEAGFQLVEIFSVEQNPGAGTLDYSVTPEQTEKIIFGTEGGLYGLAMLFNGASLPDQYGKNFRNDVIIQVALGTLRSRLESQVPQFAAATLISDRIPTRTTSFPIIVPQPGRTNPLKTMAFFLFTSPQTPNDQTDEQKLRGTYFAQGGSLQLTAKGKPKIIDVQAQGKNLRFKMYLLDMKADLKLGTPFSSQQATLKGTIQFPLYTPHGTAAEAFTRRVAGESLEGTMQLSSPPGPPPRSVASPREELGNNPKRRK